MKNLKTYRNWLLLLASILIAMTCNESQQNPAISNGIDYPHFAPTTVQLEGLWSMILVIDSSECDFYSIGDTIEKDTAKLIAIASNAFNFNSTLIDTESVASFIALDSITYRWTNVDKFDANEFNPAEDDSTWLLQLDSTVTTLTVLSSMNMTGVWENYYYDNQFEQICKDIGSIRLNKLP